MCGFGFCKELFALECFEACAGQPHNDVLTRSLFPLFQAGHPEGHPSSRSQEEELQHLKEKVDAGADFIITQFFYDVEKFLHFVQRCRGVGIACPIIPGIMPIQSYTTLIKMTQYCGVTVPESILHRLEAVNKNDDEAVKLLGCDIAAEMCRHIYAMSNGDVDGVHFYTLNLERSVTEIVGMLESIKPIDYSSTMTTTSDSSLRTRDPKSPVSPQRRQDEVRYESIRSCVSLRFSKTFSMLTFPIFSCTDPSIGPIDRSPTP